MATTFFNRTEQSKRGESPSVARAASRRVTDSRRLGALLAAGVAAVSLAACGPSAPSDSPSPSGSESTDFSISPPDTTTDPYTPSYDTTTDPYTPSYDTTTDPYTPSYDTTTDPGSYEPEPPPTTDQCAYAGDPLCPDTPITVPPPNLSPPY
jgi:hypothetical protein